MKPHIEEWNHVLVGQWNLAILNPDWLNANVFQNTQIGIELLFGLIQPQMKYVSGTVSMVTRADQVIIAVLEPTKEALSTAETVAVRLLESLPVTPVSAIGTNFGYVATDVDPKLAQVFSTSDRDQLSEAGYEISSTSLVRTFTVLDRTLNFRLSQMQDGSVRFNFNYHRDVSGAPAGADAFREKTEELRAHSQNLLEQIYDQQLEDPIV